MTIYTFPVLLKSGVLEYSHDPIRSDPILGFRGPHSWASNMYATRLELEGQEFLCAEAAYLWQKSEDDEFRQELLSCNGPAAKKLGNTSRLHALGILRDDWLKDRIKLDAMFRVQVAKYKSSRLWNLLDATENRYIEETNVWNDKYYGVCNGEGSNYLGKIIMCVRHMRRNKSL